MGMQNIKVKLEIYSKTMKYISKEIVSLLKQDCATYADLDKNFEIFTREFSWNNSYFPKSEIVQAVKKIIEEEKSSLPISIENCLNPTDYKLSMDTTDEDL